MTTGRASTRALLAGASLAACVLAGCTPDGQLVIELPATLDRRVSFIEVLVVVPWELEGERDRCGQLADLPLPLDADLARVEWELGEMGLEMDAVASAGFARADEERPSLGLVPNWSFVVVRGRDSGCSIQVEGCARADFGAGSGDKEVVVALEPADERRRCPSGYACSTARGGRCVDPTSTGEGCNEDADCNDEDLLTTDSCRDARCVTSPDGDGDGVAPPDDCDDRRAEVPGGYGCGAALDHDCDGVVDDRDGCGRLCDAGGLDLGAPVDLGVDVHAVSAAGNVVVVTTCGGRSGLWVGELVPGSAGLSELDFVDLDLECRSTLSDVALYGHVAFVTHEGGIEAVDLMDLAPGLAIPPDPALPAPLGAVGLGDAARGAPSTVVAAPPLLLVGASDGVAALDLSQVAPAFGWPWPMGLAASVPSVLDVAARGGTAFVAANQPDYLACADLSPPFDGNADEGCLDLDGLRPFDRDPTATPQVEAVATDRRGDLFLVVANITGSPRTRHVYQVRDEDVDGAFELALQEVQVAELAGFPQTTATRRLLVAAGLLFRASRDGLFVHDVADLEQLSEHLPGEDVTDVELAGGVTLVAAGGELYAARLDCTAE